MQYRSIALVSRPVCRVTNVREKLLLRHDSPGSTDKTLELTTQNVATEYHQCKCEYETRVSHEIIHVFIPLLQV